MKDILLNNGISIPTIGIGTYKVTNQVDMNNLLMTSYNSGYRMIDTASYYNNEELIGNFFNDNRKIQKELLVGTKVWPIDFDPDNTKRSIENSLNSMNLDSIDIMFLHWPSEGFVDAWKVLESYYEQKVLKSIAVCNFNENHMDKLINSANIPPVINQVELQPYLVQKNLSQYLNKENIKVEAWSPLGRGDKELFNEKTLLEISKNHNKSVPQIILRWHIEKGNIVIPKSVSPSRIKENIDIFDFSLSNEEITKIDNLNKNKRFSQDPGNESWLEEIRNG